jgi:hypothetical protein
MTAAADEAAAARVWLTADDRLSCAWRWGATLAFALP